MAWTLFIYSSAKAVFSQLFFLFLDKFSQVSQQQNTESALLRVTNDLLASLDCENHEILIQSDPSAAFDKINHPFLLDFLNHLVGIQDQALRLFAS